MKLEEAPTTCHTINIPKPLKFGKLTVSDPGINLTPSKEPIKPNFISLN